VPCDVLKGVKEYLTQIRNCDIFLKSDFLSVRFENAFIIIKRREIMLTVNKQGLFLGLFLGFLFIFSLFSAPILAEEEIPAAAVVAAQEGLLPLLEAIPVADLGHFNFSDRGEVDQAELGEPFMIYTILPERILNYKSGTSVESIISPTGVWLFPVVSNGEVRTLLTVDFVEGEWRAVSIGGSGVAKQWASITGDSSSAGGSNYKFVRVYQATADFVLMSNIKGTKMMPMESARISLELEGEGACDPSKMILELQDPVRKNIEAFKGMEGE
jgi:hypothetical protein